MLCEKLEGLGTRPVNSSGLTKVHKAVYNEREVAVKSLQTHREQSPNNIYKVRVQRLEWYCLTHRNFLAVDQGGRWVGLAQTWEHPTVHWSFSTADLVFPGLRMDALR
jgi:hypothetical protein